MCRAVILLLLLQSIGSSAAVSDVGYRVVVLSRGDKTYGLRPEDANEYSASCPAKTCTCNADIEYIQLTRNLRNPAALELINRKLRSAAGEFACKYLDAADTLHQRVTFLSDRLLSIVEDSYSQMLATGGSCHGSSAVDTFDLVTGKEYAVADIISLASLPQLRSSLPASIAAEKKRQEDQAGFESLKSTSFPGDPLLKNWKPPPQTAQVRERNLAVAEKATASLSDDELVAEPFFIDRHRVFINVDGYYYGCAAGSFHPAELPASIITSPLIRAALDSKSPTKLTPP